MEFSKNMIIKDHFFVFQTDAEDFVKVVKEVNSSSGAKVEEFDDNMLREFAYTARGDICPMAAVLGGITAQEVMKVGKLL